MTGGNTNHYTTTDLGAPNVQRQAGLKRIRNDCQAIVLGRLGVGWGLAASAILTKWAGLRLRLPKSYLNVLLFLLPLAAIAQLGERQTEDLKVPGSIPGLGICAHEKT